MDIDIEQIIDAYEPVERSVRICLKGSLVAEFEELERRLRDAKRESVRMSEPAEAVTIATRMAELREQMLANSATFRFQSIGRRYAELVETHHILDPDEKKKDGVGFAAALIVAACIKPTLTAEKLGTLAEKLSDAQYQQLYDTALAANRSTVDVPFSTLASDVLHKNEQS
jgi:hypothetical protein